MSADKCVLILHSVSYVQLYRQRQVASIYPAITRSFSCVPYSFFHLYSFPGTRFGLLDPCREYRFAGCILGSGDCSGIHISVWLTICLCRWACCLYCPIQNLKILVFYVLISFRMESLGGGVSDVYSVSIQCYTFHLWAPLLLLMILCVEMFFFGASFSKFISGLIFSNQPCVRESPVNWFSCSLTFLLSWPLDSSWMVWEPVCSFIKNMMKMEYGCLFGKGTQQWDTGIYAIYSSWIRCLLWPEWMYVMSYQPYFQ